jgi:outer membrane protein assembly factor BamA
LNRQEPDKEYLLSRYISSPIKKCIFIFILQLIIATIVYPQEQESEKNNDGWSGYPVFFYTNRTNMAFGGYGLHHFQYNNSPHTSTLSAALIYTLKGQIMTQMAGKLYWPGYRLKADVDYLDFPDTFYGIGNNTLKLAAEEFSTERIGLDIGFQKEVLSNLFIGFLYDFEKHDLYKTDPDGILQLGYLPGTQGPFNLSGLGVSLNYDSRNHVVDCQHGNYLEFSWTFYDNSIGSDYRFMEYNLDLRHFFQISQSNILAFQGTITRISGYAPIQAYPVLGDDRLRGFSARYKDKNLLTLQAEYRMKVMKKLGVVFFAGMGDVSKNFSAFNPINFKFGAGFGLRYTILPANNLNIRFDFGIGTHGNSSMTFLPGEAF